jgi:hypothetical protein
MTSNGSVRVQDLRLATPNDQVFGHFRVKGTQGSRLELLGWAIGRAAGVVRIEVLAAGSQVASVAPDRPRPDLREGFPDRDLERCGFEIAIEARGKGVSRLEVQAVLEDGARAPLGELQAVAPPRGLAGLLRRS